jgi:hypothetical protein
MWWRWNLSHPNRKDGWCQGEYYHSSTWLCWRCLQLTIDLRHRRQRREGRLSS